MIPEKKNFTVSLERLCIPFTFHPIMYIFEFRFTILLPVFCVLFLFSFFSPLPFFLGFQTLFSIPF